jgi:hypothetical protein
MPSSVRADTANVSGIGKINDVLVFIIYIEKAFKCLYDRALRKTLHYDVMGLRRNIRERSVHAISPRNYL